MTGRPTKYSPETAERIISALKAGNTLKASAGYVGVSEDSLARWRARYADFADSLSKAEAEAEVMYVAVLAKAARGGEWRAAVVWLERRRSDDWRERKELQHTGKDGQSLSALSDDDLDAQIAAYQDRTRAQTEPAPRKGETPTSD